MSLGLNASRRREKRRRRMMMLKWLAGLAIIAGAGAYAYRTGAMLAEGEVRRLEQSVAELNVRLSELGAENARLREARESALIEVEQWRQRYQKDVPTGQLAEILTRVQSRMADGVKPERLNFVIGAVSNERRCEGGPVTKRFILPTPLSTGSNDAVTFADGLITVTGRGETSVNDKGDREAWFDPSQPVTLRFIEIGGRATEATGTLPLQHSMVIGDREYRFAIRASNRSFVEVSSDVCAYP
ncbi:hypothetical protein P7L74_17170 [Tistrella mobilis]|jgi:hypothetical protein|uniref:hypothetical protein n=1 Tax=Tistrella mobilis TaxID=171437 RepID=UPI003556E643